MWKSASNDGNFDAKAFYESKKIDFQLKEAVVKNVYGAEDGFGEKIYRLRRKISGVYESCMSTSDAGVLSTMTLGEKNLLDAEVKQMYQKAGISHVLAISGLHISVIGMGLYKLLRKIKCSFFDFRCYCRHGHRRLWDDVWTWDIDHTRGAHVFRFIVRTVDWKEL